eukprot:CAMPEP_0114259774 /NCGR_PEP_ID=MMETSP0058-20121206/20084_1 /TAXON_ID=36894 /ORGANISM="Pyramimonas parkeae, CCMP726" /LENGTH=452 /DNA_ID=CAMNT_0001374867 /DNA_START=41 /DNA_END=1399 /DNA_ORIENTATION=+
MVQPGAEARANVMNHPKGNGRLLRAGHFKPAGRGARVGNSCLSTSQANSFFRSRASFSSTSIHFRSAKSRDDINKRSIRPVCSALPHPEPEGQPATETGGIDGGIGGGSGGEGGRWQGWSEGGDDYDRRRAGDEGLPRFSPLQMGSVYKKSSSTQRHSSVPTQLGRTGAANTRMETGLFKFCSSIKQCSCSLYATMIRRPLATRMAAGGCMYSLANSLASSNAGGGGRIRPPNGHLTASGFQPPEGPMQLEAQVDSSHKSPVQSLGSAHSETANGPVHGCCPSLTTKYPYSHQGDDEQIKELPGLSAARFQFVVACRQGLREAPRVCRSFLVGSLVVGPAMWACDVALLSAFPYARSQAALRAGLWHLAAHPMVLAASWSAQGLLDGKSLGQCRDMLRHHLPRTWAIGTAYWIPTHAAVSAALPAQHRPLALLVMGFMPMLYSLSAREEAAL